MASSCPKHCDDDTPSLRKVLAKGNRTRGHDIVISRGDAIVSDDGLVFKSESSTTQVALSQSVSVGGDSSSNVGGTATFKSASAFTDVAADQTTNVGGDQVTSVGGIYQSQATSFKLQVLTQIAKEAPSTSSTVPASTFILNSSNTSMSVPKCSSTICVASVGSSDTARIQQGCFPGQSDYPYCLFEKEGDYDVYGSGYSANAAYIGDTSIYGRISPPATKKFAKTQEEILIPTNLCLASDDIVILGSRVSVILQPDRNGNAAGFSVEVGDGLAGGFSSVASLEAQSASLTIAQGGLPEPRQASVSMAADKLQAGLTGAGTAYAEVSLEVDQAQLKLGSQALGSPSTTLTAQAGQLQAQLDSGAQETASCQLTPQQASLSFGGAPGSPSTLATVAAGQVEVSVSGQGTDFGSVSLTPTQARLQVGSVETGNASSTATVTAGQVGLEVVDAQSRTASCSLSPEEARLRLGTELLGGARSEISARPERLQAKVNEASEVAQVSLTKGRAQLEVARPGAGTIANVDAGAMSAITTAEAQYAQVSLNPQTASISLGSTSSSKPGASASITQDGVSLEVNTQDESASSKATLVATEAQLQVTGSELSSSASVQAGQISGLVSSTAPGGSFSSIVMTPEQTQLVLGQGGVETPATTVTLVPEKVSVEVGAGDETGSLIIGKNSIQLQTTRLLTPLIFGAQLDAASQGPTVVSADWTPRPLNAFEAIFSGFESGPDSITFTKAGAYKVAAVSSYFHTDPAAITATAVTITRAANGAVLVIPGTLVYGSGTGLVEAAGLSVEVGDVARLVYKTTVADPEGLGKANPFGEASLRASVAFS